MKSQNAFHKPLGRIWGTAGIAAGLLLPFVGTMPAQAAPAASAATGQFGGVDLGRVLAGYNKKADLDGQIQALNAKLQSQFSAQQNSPLLTRDQLNRLGVLASKTPRTDAETAEMTSLQQQAAAAAQELTSLQQKANPTDADKARLTTLTTKLQGGQQALQEISTAYTAQVQAEQDRLSARLSDQVKAAIAAVAQQRGLAAVFNSQYAVYTSNDITDEVLKRLNGK